MKLESGHPWLHNFLTNGPRDSCSQLNIYGQTHIIKSSHLRETDWLVCQAKLEALSHCTIGIIVLYVDGMVHLYRFGESGLEPSILGRVCLVCGSLNLPLTSDSRMMAE